MASIIDSAEGEIAILTNNTPDVRSIDDDRGVTSGREGRCVSC